MSFTRISLEYNAPKMDYEVILQEMCYFKLLLEGRNWFKFLDH